MGSLNISYPSWNRLGLFMNNKFLSVNLLLKNT